MKIEQIYTGCLAQGAYYIESEGEVAIVDPLRETEPYLKRAEENGAKIKYIVETHFHADFVSGHVELAEKTGAKIVFGPNAETGYDIHQAQDGEELKLGKVTLKLLHTPGHTLESSCYLLIDEQGKQKALFSGDTLFIGDVGRPDLAVKSDLTEEDLAGMMYESLRNKIMPLDDGVVVYPAHGAGSACGKNMSSETTDTLGNQRASNYALDQSMSKDDFIKELTMGILPPPQYFAKNAALNKQGPGSLDAVLEKGAVALSPDMFEAMANHEGAMVLDTRKPADFAAGHVPNSIFIGIDGGFAPWVGALIVDLQQPIIFVAEQGREEEVVTRLARVGYDNTLGFLDGGVAAWEKAGKEVARVATLSAEELAEASEQYAILDVRKPTEWEEGHLEAAESLPLDYINEEMDQVQTDKNYAVHCKSGYRSTIAISILKARGYHQLTNVTGGYLALEKTDLPITKEIKA